jgi:hypothetical protein
MSECPACGAPCRTCSGVEPGKPWKCSDCGAAYAPYEEPPLSQRGEIDYMGRCRPCGDAFAAHTRSNRAKIARTIENLGGTACTLDIRRRTAVPNVSYDLDDMARAGLIRVAGKCEAHKTRTWEAVR